MNIKDTNQKLILAHPMETERHLTDKL